MQGHGVEEVKRVDNSDWYLYEGQWLSGNRYHFGRLSYPGQAIAVWSDAF